MGQEESSHLKLLQSKEKKLENPISKSLFDFLYIIGRGGFGKVWKVRYKKTHKKYALKEMSKVKIIDRKSEKSIKNEKDFLSELQNPFLVNMICSFQDNENLYLVMDLFTGGDLRYHICHKRKFSENETKFFIGCVIIGLEYIHSKNIIHRDIKPENLVLDSNGYVAITDFGVAKINTKDNSSETSGTPGYMAPEVLCGQNHSFTVDYFALGVIGFEFMNGYRPYLGRNRKEIKEAVLSKQVRIHKKNALEIGWSIQSVDFINRMIYRKPKKRLGFFGIEEIKCHNWFIGFQWDLLKDRKMKSFFIPKNGDNFDKKYCEGIEKIDSETRRRYSYYMNRDKYKDLFLGYTFVKNELLYDNFGKSKISFVNRSNRDTTSSSLSSGNLLVYGNNNVNNVNNVNINNNFGNGNNFFGFNSFGNFNNENVNNNGIFNNDIKIENGENYDVYDKNVFEKQLVNKQFDKQYDNKMIDEVEFNDNLFKKQFEFRNRNINNKEFEKKIENKKYENKIYENNQNDNYNFDNRKYDYNLYNQKIDNNQLENKKFNNYNIYENKSYDNKQFENSLFERKSFDSKQYENNEYENNQYNSFNIYNNKQYERNPYDNKQYDNNQYDNKQYDNNQHYIKSKLIGNENSPIKNPNYNFVNSSLMNYLENHNISYYSNIRNNNNNSISNSNNNTSLSLRNNPSINAMPISFSKYSSLNFDSNKVNKNERFIYSPPHNVHNNSINYNKNKSYNDDTNKNKEYLSKTMKQNDSFINVTNKYSSPITSNSKTLSRININLNNQGLNSKINNMKHNLSNYNNRKSLYNFPNNGSNLSQTNFSNYSNNASKSKLYFHSNNNLSSNENKDIKSSRYYKKLSMEKNISIPNQPKLIKNSSMKLLHFNSSYLNNLNSNQDDNNFKLSYNNYIDNKNNRLLSAGHFNNESENYYYNYINSQRTKKMSENNSIYKKHSHSDFSQIHQHF